MYPVGGGGLMAPRPIHDPPHVQLVRLGRLARERGLSFDEFWAEAVREGKSLVMTNHPAPPEGAVRWPTDQKDRRAWVYAIRSTRDAWRRTYEREESPVCERALSMLGDSIGALDEVAAERADDELDHGLEPHEALRSAA